MKTDVITVSSSGAQMEAALAQADKMAAFKGLSGKSALHLRLLAEEMMGMMRSLTGEQEGQFWIEDSDGVYRLHLRVVTRQAGAAAGGLQQGKERGGPWPDGLAAGFV